MLSPAVRAMRRPWPPVATANRPSARPPRGRRCATHRPPVTISASGLGVSSQGDPRNGKPTPRQPLWKRSQSQQREGVNDREARSGTDFFDQGRRVSGAPTSSPAPRGARPEDLATEIDPETRSRTIASTSHLQAVGTGGSFGGRRRKGQRAYLATTDRRFGDACDSIRVPIAGKTAGRGFEDDWVRRVLRVDRLAPGMAVTRPADGLAPMPRSDTCST